MSRFHTLRREQWIPRSVDDVFRFFSDAANLGEITPPWLGFRMLTPSPVQMAPGTKLRYRLSWHGVPIGWTTEIRRWEPPLCFADVQLRGPYRLWHHTHQFAAFEGGTLMHDTVRYQLPLGWVGRLANTMKVAHDVERIFDYRSERIGERFAGSRH